MLTIFGLPLLAGAMMMPYEGAVYFDKVRYPVVIAEGLGMVPLPLRLQQQTR